MFCSPPASLPKCSRGPSLQSHLHQWTVRCNGVRYQPFHSTSPSSAPISSPKKSPSTRLRIRDTGLRASNPTASDGMLLNTTLTRAFRDHSIRLLDRNAFRYLLGARKMRIPVTEKVFLRVATQLFDRSCSMLPNEMAIRSISTGSILPPLDQPKPRELMHGSTKHRCRYGVPDCPRNSTHLAKWVLVGYRCMRASRVKTCHHPCSDGLLEW